MIKEISFLSTYRSFPEGCIFKFESGVNLLVGDQGCGKSTLLTALNEATFEVEEVKTSVVSDPLTQVRYFDFELSNPRRCLELTKGLLDFQLEVRALRMSHGQANVHILASLCKVDGRHTFLFDEPDTGLSIRSALQVAKCFGVLAERGHQIIAAVHNPVILSCFEQVCSLEHLRWMKTSEFIDSQYAQRSTKQ